MEADTKIEKQVRRRRVKQPIMNQKSRRYLVNSQANLFFQLLPSQIQRNGDDCAFLCTVETRAAHHVNGVTAEVTTGTQHL